MTKIILLLQATIILATTPSIYAQPQTSHFLIGNKSFERSLFSCEDTPGCHESSNECRWDITTCFLHCKNTPWNEDTDHCEATCMKHSSTISAFQDYPDIMHSAVESICISYHEKE
jgi:hypothetical protein